LRVSYGLGEDQSTYSISFTDPYSGVVGAGAALAALAYRRRTGRGQYIDLSEQEAAVPVAGYALMVVAVAAIAVLAGRTRVARFAA